MRRSTMRMLKGRFGLDNAQLAEVLATDAEVKRLKKALRELECMAGLRWQEVEALKLAMLAKSSAALKPTRRTRKGKKS